MWCRWHARRVVGSGRVPCAPALLLSVRQVVAGLRLPISGCPQASCPASGSLPGGSHAPPAPPCSTSDAPIGDLALQTARTPRLGAAWAGGGHHQAPLLGSVAQLSLSTAALYAAACAGVREWETRTRMVPWTKLYSASAGMDFVTVAMYFARLRASAVVANASMAPPRSTSPLSVVRREKRVQCPGL